MEPNNTLERLNAQVGALIDALQASRDEIARLNDELSACQAVTQQRQDSVNALEESMGLKDMELEDMAERIEQALSSAAPPMPEPVQQPVQQVDPMPPQQPVWNNQETMV